MAEASYNTFPAIFVSKGINARPTDDTLPQGTYLNMQSVEEVEENALCSRLGSVIVNATGGTVNALPASVHSLARLNNSVTGTAYRYAGAGTQLYRRTGNTFGAYTSIATGMSGQPWSSISYRPFLSSFPYQFFADVAKMLKDNGSSTQQMGIFQPQQPVGGTPISNAAPALLPPLTITVDTMENSVGSYTASGFSGSLSLVNRVSTTLTSAVTFITSTPTFVTVASMTNIDQFAWLDINSGGGSAETVQVLSTTATGFTAVFANTHAVTETVTKKGLSGTVPTNSTATITKTGTYNLGTFPGLVAAQGADYIGFAVNVDNPANLNEIRLQFDVSNDAFTDSYYFKAIVPSINQQTVSNLNNQTSYVSQVIYQEAIGVFAAGAISGYQLTAGQNQWTQILIPMSSFQAIGQASLTSANYTMAAITAFQVQITTNANGPVTVISDTIFAMGGFGLDSFGGVAYDWLYTYYNANTGVESNPCMFMANVAPPTNTKQVLPRRQAVKMNLQGSGDPQVTHLRIYRRGGTLASNFFRVDQIANPGAGGFTYTDTASDASISGADTVSFTNDVPVTSTLPVPVNTTLSIALTPVSGGLITTITPLSMANISVNQQVTIGKNTDPNQEIVIVIQITSGTTFAAYIQNPHKSGDPVTAQAAYGQPMNLMALAYGRAWFAGDTNNPHFLYYSNATSVEQVSSANSIEVGTPADPITAVVPFQGSLYVATLTRWYGISPITQIGGSPTVYPTTAVHGVVAPFGWITTESEIWHQAVDGIRSFAGGNSIYRTQAIEFLFQNNGTTPIVEANPAQLSQTRMTYWNNIVFLSYVGTDSNIHRLMYHCLPEEAEILTREGWKRHGELQRNEEVLAYDCDREVCEWVPVDGVTVSMFDGQLTRWEGGRNGTKFAFDFTDGHKWVWRGETGKGAAWTRGRTRLRPAEEIKQFGDIIQAAPLADDESRSLLTPDEAALLGWLVTDGCIINRGAKRYGRIYQAEKSDAIPALNALLKDVVTSVRPYKGRYAKRPGQETAMLLFLLKAAVVESLLKKCDYRTPDDLPRIAAQLNRRAAEAMLWAMMAADGHEGRQRWFCQKAEKPQIDAVRILSCICGVATSNTKDREDGTTITGLMAAPFLDCECLKRSTVHYSGRVWCPTTKHGTWVSRYRGSVSITGNTIYQRWRNDNVPATSLFTEPDTNVLLYGDANGLIHQDRVGFIDQSNNAGTIASSPVAINMQTAYLDQGQPKSQKNYNELTIDCNTGGNTLNATLLFDDGLTSVNVGNFSTTQRQKVNLNINAGLGQAAYRTSLQIIGSCSSEVILFQAAIRGVLLAETRQSMDTYWLAFGSTESKLCNQAFIEYTATQTLAGSVYYDQFTTPLFTFNLGPSIRVATRVRFPAVKFRLLRMVVTSGADFQIWPSSFFQVKMICATKGYQHMSLVP